MPIFYVPVNAFLLNTEREMRARLSVQYVLCVCYLFSGSCKWETESELLTPTTRLEIELSNSTSSASVPSRVEMLRIALCFEIP